MHQPGEEEGVSLPGLSTKNRLETDSSLWDYRFTVTWIIALFSPKAFITILLRKVAVNLLKVFVCPPWMGSQFSWRSSRGTVLEDRLLDSYMTRHHAGTMVPGRKNGL